MTDRTHIAGMTRAELEEMFLEFGEPRYRADQVFRAIHQRRLRAFDEMTDLPKKLRQKLAAEADIERLTVTSRYVSEDGTRRYLMRTVDQRPVETVFIPSEGRDTICFSSQAGCPLKCDFCLTAKLGLLRSLTAGEIVEQILIVLNDVYGVAAETPHGTNLVGMGAGEPFLNFDELIKAVRIMGEPDGLHIVPNRITISTAGIVPRIRDLALLPDRPHLAISLTAANDELRDRLMPINRKYPINELMSAAKEFEASLRRGERFTFEYVMLGGVNDSDRDADRLAELLDRFQLSRVKVNLIPHNGADQLDYAASTPERVAAFKQRLGSKGVDAYVRTPRGRDIFAACGQLAAKAI
ncbi:MAG: 23S rRNA (adenine(2503)-C(2))-methyltransferase RlmN [Acidobacteria bacterium]|nr:23S rRNA (adenine(2503)-C(2))-methyltransferase RlmN [Acidobacteriota bacterium]MCW5950019.1 23S rRNA (adenine(2503)-C(2))-methyltransferase RlmN [Pyrinomonadaceae bacterium]